jgi:uncharacterized membrane protein
MAAILTNLNNTIIAGFVLALVLLLLLAGWHGAGAGFDQAWWAFLFRWLHVLSGVMWIGILWYFNFVQIPNMPNIPAEQRPAITGVIAPAALFWFRWGAMSTIITGLILAWLNGYLVDAISIGLTVLTDQHDAVHPDALCDGIGTEFVLIRLQNGFWRGAFWPPVFSGTLEHIPTIWNHLTG